MFSKIKSLEIRYFNKIVNSIAFYPTTVVIGLFLLSVVLLEVDGSGMKDTLDKHTPYLVINNADTARVILSTLIGGVISLTVFSFSMVMITLNQASANFSPRLLPGLISEKKNQFVLGFYLGTIIFNLIVLISVLPSGESNTLNVLSIIVGIFLGVMCLALFIYFIHNISSSIQIKNILHDIYKTTYSSIGKLCDQDQDESPVKVSEEWFVIRSKESGYYHGYDKNELLKICEDLSIDVVIDVQLGQFIMPKFPVIRTSKKLDQKEVNAILDLLYLNDKNDLTRHYVFGINQITEVGVRSMSPGINDPATALITLDYLSVLFCERMKIHDYKVQMSDSKSSKIQENRASFCNLINTTFAAYRVYVKHDLVVMKKLQQILQYLKIQEYRDANYIQCIENQIDTLNMDAEDNIKNEHDLKAFMNN
jgi:uncharacterized membrane protein